MAIVLGFGVRAAGAATAQAVDGRRPLRARSRGRLRHRTDRAQPEHPPLGPRRHGLRGDRRRRRHVRRRQFETDPRSVGLTGGNAQKIRDSDLRVPDERARLRAPRRTHGRRRHGRPSTDESEADVVIFNTCTIRENADLKLYSALGQMKAIKEAHPEMQIAVGGCMAQKDRGQIIERAGWVDVVFGTHNLAAAPRLLERSRRRGSRSSRSWTPRTRGRIATWRRRSTRCANWPSRHGSRSKPAVTTRAPTASCRRCAARRSADRSTTS